MGFRERIYIRRRAVLIFVSQGGGGVANKIQMIASHFGVATGAARKRVDLGMVVAGVTTLEPFGQSAEAREIIFM